MFKKAIALLSVIVIGVFCVAATYSSVVKILHKNNALVIRDGGTLKFGTDEDVSISWDNEKVQVAGPLGRRWLVQEISSTPVTIASASAGEIIYTASTGNIEVDLPAAVQGMEFSFMVGSTGNLIIDPNSTDQILGLTDSGGDSVTNTGNAGDHLTLVSPVANKWFPTSATGTWSDSN